MPESGTSRGRDNTSGRIADIIATQLLAKIPRNATERVRILDPCCGAGGAVRKIALALSSAPDNVKTQTYGVELDETLAARAATILDHVINCDLFEVSIAHNAFNLLFLNPPPKGGGLGRTGHSFLAQSTRYLAPNGALVFITPRKDVKASARHIATNYTQIRLHTYPLEQYRRQPKAVIIAKRSQAPDRNLEIEQYIEEWAEADLTDTASIEIAQGKTIVETSPMEDILFTRRHMDPEEAALEAQRHGVWASPLIHSRLWPGEENNTKPLMPLRKGHAATVIAAGLLNNMCLEQDGRRIIVKGRTIKNKVLVQVNNGINQTEETWQDRMSILVMSLDLTTGEITEIKA